MSFTSDPPAIDPRLLESGGALALDIDGLPGDTADPQDPKPHGQSHESGQSDAIDITTLAFTGSDGQVLAVNSGSLNFETPSAGVTQADLDARYDGFFPDVLG